jgi:hypothetical protein
VRTVPGVRTWLKTATPAPSGRVTGRVLRAGQPVEGATITSGGALTYTLTGPDGRYTLDNVPAGASWVKAGQERGADWAFGTVPQGGTWEAPDLNLDLKKASIEYGSPGWDPDGSGLWLVHTARWLEEGGSAPRFEPSLRHLARDGGNEQTVYQPENGSLGPPRVRPGHPGEVAVADGTTLVLLTTDLGAPEGARVRARQVLAQPVLRDSPLSWSPDGARLYFAVARDAEFVQLQELTLAGGALHTVVTFRPYYQPETGFDTSPDGTQVVYEQDGDLYIADLAPADPAAKPAHITYRGGASRPSWSGR